MVDYLSEKSFVIPNGFTIQLKDFASVGMADGLTTTEVTKEVDGFTISQLISNIGGAAGVLLGASFLSVFRMVFEYFRK